MTAAEQIESMFAEHGAFVFRVVRRLGAPSKEADDLSQEVFLTAFRLLPDFDGRSPRGWLFRIATRITSDYRKRASTRRERLDEAMPDERAPSADGQERLVWDGQLRAALDDALDTLPDAERAIFLLYELEGLPMRECAEVAGCPLQTGYSRLKAARERMRVHLVAQSEIVQSLSLREVV